MPSQLVFADSEVSCLHSGPASQALRIDFAAALLQHSACSPEGPGFSSGFSKGFSNGVSLQLEQPQVDGDLAACVGRLSDGCLRLGEQRLHAVDVPATYQPAAATSLRLELGFANGAWLQVQATALHVELADGARSVGVFQC